ncbi:hypothetical protein BH23ACT2_BH23ACT2_21850 [soil metagenome]
MSDPSNTAEPPRPSAPRDGGGVTSQSRGSDPARATGTGPVDVAVLARIEQELGAVDDALAAIDAGDLERSPLLVELLGAEGASAGDRAPAP